MGRRQEAEGGRRLGEGLGVCIYRGSEGVAGQWWIMDRVVWLAVLVSECE